MFPAARSYRSPTTARRPPARGTCTPTCARSATRGSTTTGTAAWSTTVPARCILTRAGCWSGAWKTAGRPDRIQTRRLRSAAVPSVSLHRRRRGPILARAVQTPRVGLPYTLTTRKDVDNNSQTP